MVTTSAGQRSSREGRAEPSVVPVAGERQVAYAEYGRPGGDPVVFLHGTPGSRRLGALLDSPAREFDIRVLAPDRPGYGHATPWPNRTVADAAAFVTPVLDDADVETASLVAFSGGSPYALAVAASDPERISRVDVIAGATPPALSDGPPPMQRLLTGLARTTPWVLRGLLRGQAWLASRMDPSVVVGQYAADPDAVPDAVADVVRADFLEAVAHHRSGAVTEFRQTATDWEIDLGTIGCEVGLWHGESDANVPIESVRRLADRLPTAELHVLEDADHLETLRRSIPEVLASEG